MVHHDGHDRGVPVAQHVQPHLQQAAPGNTQQHPTNTLIQCTMTCSNDQLTRGIIKGCRRPPSPGPSALSYPQSTTLSSPPPA
jgi:hypothetical protein